jgi:hypothetical protein
MKNLIILFSIVLFSIPTFASDDINTQTSIELSTKKRNRMKRAKKRSQRKHGIYHSKCMRTKRIRVK